jgi:hypothetical protein
MKVKKDLEKAAQGDNNDDDLSMGSSISSSCSGLSFVKDDSSVDFSVKIPSQDSVSVDSAMYNDFEKLHKGLIQRAENLGAVSSNRTKDSSSIGTNSSHFDTASADSSQVAIRRRSSRNINRQLHRLYKGRTHTTGLMFSKGHFLADISKMVAGLLSTEYKGSDDSDLALQDQDDLSAKYGFGEKSDGAADQNRKRVGELTIHEQEGDQHIVHSSTLAAGKDGCVVLVFPKPSLSIFLDEYPGLLLSLLGTQVVL